jgi:hypothetical protein
MQIHKEIAHLPKAYNTSKKDYSHLTVYVHTLYAVFNNKNKGEGMHSKNTHTLITTLCFAKY